MMKRKHTHCTTITRTPAVAQTALQVKLGFVTQLTDVMFEMADTLFTTATDMFASFGENVAGIKGSS
jgi:hypothetical protein